MTKGSKKTNVYLMLGVAIFLVALFLYGFLPRMTQWDKIQAIADDPTLPSVTIEIANSEKKPLILVLPSVSQALFVTPIWARVDGYLSQFLVDIGDHVDQDQLLAVIDTPEVDKQLSQAKADLLSSKAKLNIAKISAERWQNLFSRNPQAVSTQEVDERLATLLAGEADVKALEANVERLEKVQGFNKILAPFKGKIIERNIDLGSLITAGSNGNPQQLFKIANDKIIRIFVYVPQYYFRRIQTGMPTDVIVREFPGQVFSGTVIRTAQALDPVSRTLLTEIHIDNEKGTLIPGLYTEVRFLIEPEGAFFIIPTRAVIIRNGGPMVALLESNNTAKLVKVVLGRDFGKTMEITSGLKEGDHIITNPTDKIKEGVQVQVIKEANSSPLS